jgi:hypothetical protein
MAYAAALTLADACHRRMRSGEGKAFRDASWVSREASRFSAAQFGGYLRVRSRNAATLCERG